MKIGDPGHSHIEGEAKTLQKSGIPGVDPDLIEIQCFPFYSVLLAIGRTSLDFFSLDVEGHELQILKTIPWNKVNIKVYIIWSLNLIFEEVKRLLTIKETEKSKKFI